MRKLLIAIIAMFILPIVVLGETFSYTSDENDDIKDFSIDKLQFKTIQWAEYINFKGSGKP